MKITGLDHYNIATADLEKARSFYTKVVGFRDGERPPFGKPGAWMYMGDHAILHIGTVRVPKTKGKSDSYDHVAFRVSDIDEVRARLKQHNIYAEEFAVPARNMHQIFFRDPDGNEIELLFFGADAEKAKAEGARVDSTIGRTV
jgi:catechol 2,3-dioxygenase-like lactoylglutathione lyase family enzyme